jgi:hypothetical protein
MIYFASNLVRSQMFMKVFLFLTFFTTLTCANAQAIKVSNETVRLKGESAEGSEIQLEGTYEQVESSLLKYLKPVGKTKKADEGFVIALPTINGKSYTTPVYAIVRDKGKGAAWIGILPSEWPGNTEEVKKDIEKIVYDFGVNFYKDKIQLQIDESTRALQAVERQQQRLVNQSKDLDSKLDNNKKEKIQLEKSLENNKVDFESLNKKIAQNKLDQDSVAIAGEQIKKVIQMHKDKQARVN